MLGVLDDLRSDHPLSKVFREDAERRADELIDRLSPKLMGMKIKEDPSLPFNAEIINHTSYPRVVYIDGNTYEQLSENSPLTIIEVRKGKY